jgi:hypothetical protein
MHTNLKPSMMTRIFPLLHYISLLLEFSKTFLDTDIGAVTPALDNRHT